MQPLSEQIVQAAVKLFAGRGFHGTSMRAIAHAAGVSIGAIYHHFPSKDDVFLAILREEYERRRVAIEELKAQGLPPRDMVRRVAKLHFELLHRRRDSVRLLSQTLPREHPRLRGQLEALEEEFAGHVARLLEEGMEAGQVRKCDAWTAAYALLGMAKAVTARALGGDKKAEELRCRGPEELAELAWRALRP
ncbi:MAG: TetR/AcrR family transcriptional regulator [Candidatus Bipolaricaulota bacterium]